MGEQRLEAREARRGEGLACPAVPAAGPFRPVEGRGFRRPARAGSALPCPICGAEVVAQRRGRMCLRCGFMTGREEGF